MTDCFSVSRFFSFFGGCGGNKVVGEGAWHTRGIFVSCVLLFLIKRREHWFYSAGVFTLLDVLV